MGELVKLYNFVIKVVILDTSVYNKNVILKHKNYNKNVMLKCKNFNKNVRK